MSVSENFSLCHGQWRREPKLTKGDDLPAFLKEAVHSHDAYSSRVGVQQLPNLQALHSLPESVIVVWHVIKPEGQIIQVLERATATPEVFVLDAFLLYGLADLLLDAALAP